MRNDPPALLLLLALHTTFSATSARSLARPARLSGIGVTIGSSIGLGLVVLVASLLTSISIGVEGAAAQTLLTSDCPDGRSVCRVDSRPSKGATSAADAAEFVAGATPEAEASRDAMPLVLTNADLGSTREALLERDAAERAVRLQRESERKRAIERRQAIGSDAVGAAHEGGANALIRGDGASESAAADEVWVSMPRDGERVTVGTAGAQDARVDPDAEGLRGSESAPSSIASSEESQRSLADCMERSIRAGNAFAESRRVCEALFPRP